MKGTAVALCIAYGAGGDPTGVIFFIANLANALSVFGAFHAAFDLVTKEAIEVTGVEKPKSLCVIAAIESIAIALFLIFIAGRTTRAFRITTSSTDSAGCSPCAIGGACIDIGILTFFLAYVACGAGRGCGVAALGAIVLMQPSVVLLADKSRIAHTLCRAWCAYATHFVVANGQKRTSDADRVVIETVLLGVALFKDIGIAFCLACSAKGASRFLNVAALGAGFPLFPCADRALIAVILTIRTVLLALFLASFAQGGGCLTFVC